MFKGRNTRNSVTPCKARRIDTKFCTVRERLPYEPLLIEAQGDGSCRMVSDVDLLFNQDRLDRMSLSCLQQRMDESQRAGNTGLAELRKNIKDEDLQRFIKSRYIQSLSELSTWSNYLAEEYGNTVKGINNYLASMQAAKQEPPKSEAAKE